MSQGLLTVKRADAELIPILMDAQVIMQGQLWLALPREVILVEGSVDSIVFQLLKKDQTNRLSWFWVVLKAARPETWGLTLAPFLAVFTYGGLICRWTIDFKMIFWIFSSVLLFQVAANLLSDVADHLRLLDLPGTGGGSRVIQEGWMSARQVRMLGYLSLVSAGLFGVPIALERPVFLLMMGLLAGLGILAYSNPWIGMKYRPLGDLFVFILLGPLLTVCFSMAGMGRADRSVVLLGIFFGSLAWAGVHFRNIRDMEMDRSRGTLTLASWMDFRWARLLLISLYGLAGLSLGAGIIWGRLPGSLAVAVSLGLPYWTKGVFRMMKASGPASALLGGKSLSSTQFQWLMCFLVMVGLLFSSLASWKV